MTIVIKKESSKKKIEEALKKLKKGKRFPASKFNGKMKIEGDALEIQKRLRDEWK